MLLGADIHDLSGLQGHLYLCDHMTLKTDQVTICDAYLGSSRKAARSTE
jgi:hypothetical protein